MKSRHLMLEARLHTLELAVERLAGRMALLEGNIDHLAADHVDEVASLGAQVADAHRRIGAAAKGQAA